MSRSIKLDTVPLSTIGRRGCLHDTLSGAVCTTCTTQCLKHAVPRLRVHIDRTHAHEIPLHKTTSVSLCQMQMLWHSVSV